MISPTMLASAAVSTADQLPMTDDSPEMMACPECAAPTTCLLDDNQGNRVLVSILLGLLILLVLSTTGLMRDKNNTAASRLKAVVDLKTRELEVKTRELEAKKRELSELATAHRQLEASTRELAATSEANPVIPPSAASAALAVGPVEAVMEAATEAAPPEASPAAASSAPVKKWPTVKAAEALVKAKRSSDMVMAVDMTNVDPATAAYVAGKAPVGGLKG